MLWNLQNSWMDFLQTPHMHKIHLWAANKLKKLLCDGDSFSPPSPIPFFDLES